MPRWKRLLQIAAASIIVFLGAYAVGTAVAGPFFWYSCSLNGLDVHGPATASILFARDGTRLGTLGATDRLPVTHEHIAPLMRTAIVDTEDRRFYSNDGIDFIGILRALKADLGAGQVTQGASTIEQQLVRNLYLSPQQSLTRKLTEGCLAVQLDQKWSKQRILTAYLNDVYFGQQAYGVEAAARTYFGVRAQKLTLEQAALLAGLPQAPSAYDPIERPAAARARRTEVLQAMLQAGDISPSRYRQAVHSPLGLHPRRAPTLASESYLTDFVTSQLVSEYGAERVRRGGLRVFTTLDSKMQTAATRSILGTLDRKRDPAGAIVSIDPASGQIRAMAVAQDSGPIAYDVAADGQRQAGSTFKMFALADAVSQKINPWTTRYLSAPFTGPGNWHVQTYEHTYSGRIPLDQATILSDNTVFARLALDLGPQSIADLAQKMGITSALKPVPSIVLGVNAISPLDLASAYATLAAGGVFHRPAIVTKVVFPDGHTEQASQSRGKRVLDPKVAAAVTRVLEENVQRGTGTAAALSGRPAAGKTGTTDNYTDAWFAGWVPQLATVSWVGYPNAEKPLRDVHGIPGVTGGTLPAEIWHTYMTNALQGAPAERFANPGAPPYKPWCGRYQFALTWRQARPQGGCTKKKRRTTTQKQRRKTTTRHKQHPRTTTAVTTTVATTTKKKKPPPPPPTTTTTVPPPPPTTTTTTTTSATTTTTTTKKKGPPKPPKK